MVALVTAGRARKCRLCTGCTPQTCRGCAPLKVSCLGHVRERSWLCLHEQAHCLQVEVQEPEAYMYDGEYERKAAELNHPDLISIRQSTVSPACLMHVFLTTFLLTLPLSTLTLGDEHLQIAPDSIQLIQRSAALCTSTLRKQHLLRCSRNFITLRWSACSLDTSMHAVWQVWGLDNSSRPVQDEFIFRVEGTGVLSVEEVVLTAVDVLTAKLRNLQQALPHEITGEE